MPTSPPSDLGLAARSVAFHPTEAELREYTDAMPQARRTEYGNVNVQTKVVSRSKGSTYVVTDRPSDHSDQTIDRQEGARLAAFQASPSKAIRSGEIAWCACSGVTSSVAVRMSWSTSM